MLMFPHDIILDPTFFLLYNNDINNVICNIVIYADDTTLYLKGDQASDLWQQLELASELKFDIQDTMDWSRKRLVDFNTGKTQLALSDWSNNSDAIDMKMDEFVLEENHFLGYWDCLFLLKFISYVVYIAKTAFKKLKFLFLRLFFISINIPWYEHGETLSKSFLNLEKNMLFKIK